MKKRITQDDNAASGCEFFFVEVTWWIFYILTGVIPGVLIRLNYFLVAEDDIASEEQELLFLRAREIKISERQHLVIQFLKLGMNKLFAMFVNINALLFFHITMQQPGIIMISRIHIFRCTV